MQRWRLGETEPKFPKICICPDNDQGNIQTQVGNLFVVVFPYDERKCKDQTRVIPKQILQKEAKQMEDMQNEQERDI